MSASADSKDSGDIAPRYYREAQLIGRSAVTPEQAAANRTQGKRRRRPRTAVLGMIPWSSATLWRKVSAREFPAPVKLSSNITAWNAAEVQAWLDARAAEARDE